MLFLEQAQLDGRWQRNSSGRGERVRMVNRSGKMAEVPTGAEVVASDLYDPAKVREVTRDAKVVYQASQPHYHEWLEKFPPLQKSIIED